MKGSILIYVEAIFAVVYLAGGFYLLLGPPLLQSQNRTFQTAFGLLLLAYSGYRFFRFFKKLRQDDEKDPSD